MRCSAPFYHYNSITPSLYNTDLPICFPLMKTLGTVFCPVCSSRIFCISSPIVPNSSNSTASKSILFSLKAALSFLQKGHHDLENTITLFSLMAFVTASLGSSPFTTGGMVPVERWQPVVVCKLRLKLKTETDFGLSEKHRSCGKGAALPR